MKEKDKEILYRLIRDHEDMVGSSRMAMLALRAFMISIRELKCPAQQMRSQYLELADAIKNTQPRIIPLIHLIEEFESEMEPHFSLEVDQIRQKAAEILQAKLDKLQHKIGKIIEIGLTCIADGDVIVVHTASSDVVKMIAMAKEVLGKKIKVIILKQDFVKTKSLITTLQEARVDLETVPEYSLSHYIGQANKMFFGTLSITHDLQAVTAVGTANIASLCHFHKIPVYLFANTLKFSHRASEDQSIHEKRVSQVQDSCDYVLTTYSHDMVDLKMVDYLVTEEGITPGDQIEAFVRTMSKR